LDLPPDSTQPSPDTQIAELYIGFPQNDKNDNLRHFSSTLAQGSINVVPRSAKYQAFAAAGEIGSSLMQLSTG
jgi:hypothetical protein